MHIDGSLSGFEYVHLMRELVSLEGGRINKIYQNGSVFLFSVYTGDLRTNLLVDIPKGMYFTDAKPEMPKMPGGFCMFLRKRLTNSRVNRVVQRSSERIIEFHVSTRDSEYILFFEMFGKGNLVVCDSDRKIISAFDSVSYQDRSVRGGVLYEYPPSQPDFTSLSFAEFSDFFGDDQVVKVLASVIGLGGEFAELVCSRSGVDKSAVNVDLQAVYSALSDLLSEYDPQYSSDRAYPVRVLEDATSVDSFSFALSSLLDPARKQQRKDDLVASSEKRYDKYDRIISAQEKQLSGLQDSSVVNQRKGELLYERYQEVDSLLSSARVDRKRMSEEAFVKKYLAHPLVVDVDGLFLTVDIE
jgi:predicted ribosome quality control (RQC) complex YloA/Tae2 family protein